MLYITLTSRTPGKICWITNTLKDSAYWPWCLERYTDHEYRDAMTYPIEKMRNNCLPMPVSARRCP